VNLAQNNFDGAKKRFAQKAQANLTTETKKHNGSLSK